MKNKSNYLMTTKYKVVLTKEDGTKAEWAHRIMAGLTHDLETQAQAKTLARKMAKANNLPISRFEIAEAQS